MVFPIVVQPDPQEPWFEQTWIYIISENFQENMSSSSQVILEKIFKWPHIFVIISPLKRTWPFIYIILNPLDRRMICTKLDWNWPTGSGEDFFQYKQM
jgi:hypothetical protein